MMSDSARISSDIPLRAYLNGNLSAYDRSYDLEVAIQMVQEQILIVYSAAVPAMEYSLICEEEQGVEIGEEHASGKEW